MPVIVPELNMLTPAELKTLIPWMPEIVPLLLIPPEKGPEIAMAAPPVLEIRPALVMPPETVPLRRITGPFSDNLPVLLLKMPPDRVDPAFT